MSILDFLAPNYVQRQKFDTAAKNIGNQLGQDFDNMGQPVEGPQRPGIIEPNKYNMNDLAMAHQLIYSGNTDMQNEALKAVEGLVGNQATRKRLKDIYSQGGNLDNQLGMLAQDPQFYELGYKQRVSRANDNPPTVPGIAGEFQAAQQLGYTLPNETMEQFAQRMAMAKAKGKSQGDSNNDTNAKKKYNEMLGLGVPQDIARGVAYGLYQQQTIDNKEVLLDLSTNPPGIVGQFKKEGYGKNAGVKFQPNPDYKRKPFQSPWGQDMKNTPANQAGKVKNFKSFNDLPK